jgi:hypothetical protein
MTKYENIIEQSNCDNNNTNRKYALLKLLKIFESKPNDGNVGIIESDLDTIRKIIKLDKENTIFTIFKRVILPFSITLRGRGFEYSENNKNNGEIRNSLNNLENHFYEKNQYSSWCKIKIMEDDKTSPKSLYGQANYFFRLPIEFDDKLLFPEFSILKDINFASVTTYTNDFNKIKNTKTSKASKIFNSLHPSKLNLSNSHLNTINITNGNCNSMKNSNPSFITLDEILPTEVLTFAFIDREVFNYKAIYPYDDYNSTMLDEYVEKFMISLNDEIWHWKTNWYLAFIDGSPENLVEKENKDILEEVEFEDCFWDTVLENLKTKYNYW